MHSNQLRPFGRGDNEVSVDSREEIVVNNMKLRTDLESTKIAYQPDGAGMKRRGSHILSLTRPRLPLRYFLSILKPRVENINRTPPWMSINQGTECSSGSRPNLIWGEFGPHRGNGIVKMNGVTEGQRPQFLVIFGRPSKSSVDHHGSSCTNSIFNGIFGNPVMMMGPDSTVSDGLSL